MNLATFKQGQQGRKPMSSTEALQYQHLEKQLQVKQLQVSALLEVTQAINNNLSSDKLFRIYEFILRAQISVKRLAVYLQDNSLNCICQYGLAPDFDPDSLLEEIIQYNRLTFFDDAPNPRLGEFDLIIPVYHKDKPLAFALLGEPEVDENETLDEKIKFIRTITNIIVVAVENKRLFEQQLEQEKLKREMELAAEVQNLLIPREFPEDDHMEMAGVYLPHHDIGGDYYDYLSLDNERRLFCIADISGKGIAAAILMANFQAILRALAKQETDFRQFVISLNEMVTDITKGEKFITLFVAVYHLPSRTLQYINAGHNPPLLYQEGKFISLEKGCTILGMFESLPALEVGTIKIAPGALLVNYTDGLTDLENEEGLNYTLDNLRSYILDHREYSMKVFNNQLMKLIYAFKGNQAFIDDISILTCKFK